MFTLEHLLLSHPCLLTNGPDPPPALPIWFIAAHNFEHPPDGTFAGHVVTAWSLVPKNILVVLYQFLDVNKMGLVFACHGAICHLLLLLLIVNGWPSWRISTSPIAVPIFNFANEINEDLN